MKNKTIYKIFIIPSSDEERFFDECDSYEEALRIADKEDCCFSNEFIFNTPEEKDAFILGYNSGVGYMGEGLHYTTHQNKDE